MYDVIIVGAGPAGFAASIYSSCYHLSNVVIGKELGGQMRWAMEIFNYPGFIQISGRELTERMVSQVKNRGGIILESLVTGIEKTQTGFALTLEDGKIIEGRAIILTTGTERKKLNVPGEQEYTGKGVYYCVKCERQDYEGKTVAIVGGANSAAQSAVHLASGSAKVHMLYRGGQLRCDPIWLEHITEHPNIRVWKDTTISEILGDGHKVTGVKLKSAGADQTLPLNKIFIEIGGVPGTSLVSPLGVAMDSGGFIHVDEHLATNVLGVFAAGDLISYGLSIEQISSAVGLGARAAASVFSYLKNKKPTAWGASIITRQ